MSVILACGHAAPVDSPCPICVGLDPRASELLVPAPDVTGREARCSCGKIVPSDPARLAFFEFRGDGSRQARESCKRCRYSVVAHDRKKATGEAHLSYVCDEFEPMGAWDYDAYYCGCRGWD